MIYQLQNNRCRLHHAQRKIGKHYGLEGPKSQHFERTSLKGTNRDGGILGHASIHLSGSDGAESHPIRRAVWVA